MIIGSNMCPQFWQCPRVRLGYLCLNTMFTYLKVMLPDGLMPSVGWRDLLSASVLIPSDLIIRSVSDLACRA